jgi:predicted dehydrogenase
MKPIRLAIIGCGGWVRSHLKAINDHVPEFRIAALCDTDAAHARRLRREFLPRRRVEIYAIATEMLAKVRPDAVIVSTPHALHYRHCRAALAAGAHVLVDKPMVTNSAHARRLVAMAEKAGCILQIAIQGTYTDTFAYARKLISDGTMGELQLVMGLMAQGWLEGTRGKWRQRPKLSGGGQLYDSTSHVLSAMMFLVDSPVAEVFCWADNKGAAVDINAVGSIRFANGCMGSIVSGGNCPTFRSFLSLQGDAAYMEISPHGGQFHVVSRKGDLDIRKVPKGWKVPTVTPARNFADAILGKAEPRCGGRLGVLLADLMDALYASAQRGRPVKVQAGKP